MICCQRWLLFAVLDLILSNRYRISTAYYRKRYSHMMHLYAISVCPFLLAFHLNTPMICENSLV